MESDYLTMQETLRFLDMCVQKHKFIFGIERFIKEDDSVKPDLDGIADFSLLYPDKDIDIDIDSAVDLAKNFLSRYGNNEDEMFVIVT